MDTPSQIASKAIEEWATRKEAILSWRPTDHIEEIVREEQLRVIEEMEAPLAMVLESIDEFNKQSMREHLKLVSTYGDILPPEIKKRYVDTVMKWSVI